MKAMKNTGNRLHNPDKLNRVDFHWHIVRTLPHQEKKLAAILKDGQAKTDNILEVYCPTHTTVSVARNGKDEQSPLFAGYVFVLATEEALTAFINQYYPDGIVLHGRKNSSKKESRLWTIPEPQMRAFMDFNENYADRVVILERPYSDYAFNPKTNEPNEIVKVIDGPLAGREGYLVRFRRDKRMVFKMKALESDQYYTVSIPNVWDFHVIRLHNAENDRQTVGTRKERAADLLVGMLQDCGYGEQTLPMLYDMTERLSAKPSLVMLCQELFKRGHEALSRRLAQIDAPEAGLILDLARYEHDNPGYVKSHWEKLLLRPFLTPTAGTFLEDGKDEAELPHKDFTEIIRRIHIREQVYYPSKEREETVVTPYYAHIGIVSSPHKETPNQKSVLFANWDSFLSEYFLTAGKANERLVNGTMQRQRDEAANDKKEKLIESFRNYAPTLYNVLTDEASPVKAIPAFKIGGKTLNVMAVTTTDIASGKNELINTCADICMEINATTHLAIWRRFLRKVWLHQ